MLVTVIQSNGKAAYYGGATKVAMHDGIITIDHTNDAGFEVSIVRPLLDREIEIKGGERVVGFQRFPQWKPQKECVLKGTKGKQ